MGEKNNKQREREFEERLGAGDGIGALQLVTMRFGPPLDEEKILRIEKIFEEKLKKGDEGARAVLNRCYCVGWRRVGKALALYEEAAERGNAEAEWQLGLIYLNRTEDHKTGREWIMRAAKHGHEQAKIAVEEEDWND